MKLVYRELRSRAGRYMRSERPDHTLQPTALVHEAYLRLTHKDQIDWQSRAHFYAVASGEMRRILVDHARNRGAAKRGGPVEKIALEDAAVYCTSRPEELLALDEALRQLAGMGPEGGSRRRDAVLRRPDGNRDCRSAGCLSAHRETRLAHGTGVAAWPDGRGQGLTPERWRKLSEIFNAARELDPAARDEFIGRECAGDEQMRAEVMRWLEEDAKGSGFLDRPVWGDRTESLPAAVALSSGEIVSGRYRIVRFIARGGMGEVYEAEDLELKGRVALKTLLPEIAADPRMIARFKQEIQLSRQIAHPNVCKVFDVDRHPPGSSPSQIVLLSMEYLAGETLAQELERAGRMSVDEALPVVRQMAAALDAAHAAGVIHRDFKTSNVMLVPASGGVRAVVTDFGLARKAAPDDESTATLPGRVAGTLDYMAPELLSGGRRRWRRTCTPSA